MKCPKCGGEMEEGRNIEHTMVDQEENWGKIIEEKAMIGTIKKFIEQKVIKAYRCKSCGYLESYAK